MIRLLCFSLVLVSSAAFSDPVCDLVISDCPEMFQDQVLEVPESIVSISPSIRYCSQSFTATAPPSIVLVIDNSGSMSPYHQPDFNNDPTNARFRVVSELLDEIYRARPDAEVGLVVFGNFLHYDYRDNPIFERLFEPGDWPDFYLRFLDLFPTSDWPDSYVPLIKLNHVFPNGRLGIDTLQWALELTDDGMRLKHKTTRAGVRMNEDWFRENGTGTDITLAFTAAKKAMEASTAAKDRQYIIFLSDGIPSYVDNEFLFRAPGKPPPDYVTYFATGENTPTTFTVFFGSAVGVPELLATMTLNIRANGYSASNPISNIWGIETPENDLKNLLIYPILSDILNPVAPVQAVIGADTTQSVDQNNFIFPSRTPLEPDTTKFDLEFTYNYEDSSGGAPVMVDTTISYQFTVVRVPGAELPPGTSIECRDRLLGVYADNTAYSTVSSEQADLEARLFLSAGETCAGCQVEITHAGGDDQVTVDLSALENYFSGFFSQDTLTAVPGDTILQHLNPDTLVLFWRNPLIPLDTLLITVPFSQEAVVDTGLKFDSLVVEPPAMTLYVDSVTGQLSAVLYPLGTADQIIWTSSDTSVALVSATGEVTPVSPGVANIIATAFSDSTKTDIAVITVFPKDTASQFDSLVIQPDSLTLYTGLFPGQLEAVLYPLGSTAQIVWISSDTSIARVSRLGEVTAVSPGTASIIAYVFTNAAIRDSAVVTVITPDTGIQIDSLVVEPGTLTLDSGQLPVQLTATLYPAGTTDQIIWITSDITVARVSNAGLVAPVDPGEASIIAVALSDTTKRDTAFITVLPDTSVPELPWLRIYFTGLDGGEIFELEENDQPTRFKVILETSRNFFWTDTLYVLLLSSHGDKLAVPLVLSADSIDVFEGMVDFGFSLSFDPDNEVLEGVLDTSAPINEVLIITQVDTASAALIITSSYIPAGSAWIIDGNLDGRADTMFIKFDTSLTYLPDTVTLLREEAGALETVMTVAHLAGTPASSPVQLHPENDSILILDLSAGNFDFGATDPSATATAAALPLNPVFLGQQLTVEDRLNPVLVRAVIHPADFKSYMQEQDSLIVMFPDTLKITLSEPLLPISEDGALDSLFSYFFADAGMEDALPLKIRGEPFEVSSDSLEWTFLLAVKIDVQGLKMDDYVFLNPDAPYRDAAGNAPLAIPVQVEGREHELNTGISSGLINPVIGQGISSAEFRLSRDQVIPILDENGEVTGYKDNITLNQWIPPMYMRRDGSINENKQQECLEDSVTGTFQSPASIPVNCLSAIVVFTQGPYTARVNIHDHLGKFIHSSVQRFGYCGELENDQRLRPEGYMSFLVWNLKNTEGEYVGSGVYIWQVEFAFPGGRSRAMAYRQGYAKGENPAKSCAVSD